MNMLYHCSISVISVMNYVWQRWITPHTTPWPQTTPQICSAVTLAFGIKSLNDELSQWCRWSNDNDPGMNILSHHLRSVIWVMDYVWQGWMTPHTTPWPQTTLQTYSAVILDIGIKNLNNATPDQRCSGPRMMTQVWTCYPMITWVLYEALAMYNRGG